MLSLVVIGLLAACSDVTGPGGGNDGVVVIGVESGNNQTVVVTNNLSKPVVGRMVRTRDGGASFTLLPDGPNYQDGTVVNGSPIAGAVVCAVNVASSHGPKPWTPCTNTDNEGRATFWFTADSVAGTFVTEIRGSLNGTPAVFDSVTTRQLPAAVKSGYNYGTGGVGDYKPLVIPAHVVQDIYGNPIPFRVAFAPVVGGSASEDVTGTIFSLVPDAEAGTVEARTINRTHATDGWRNIELYDENDVLVATGKVVVVGATIYSMTTTI